MQWVYIRQFHLLGWINTLLRNILFFQVSPVITRLSAFKMISLVDRNKGSLMDPRTHSAHSIPPWNIYTHTLLVHWWNRHRLVRLVLLFSVLSEMLPYMKGKDNEGLFQKVAPQSLQDGFKGLFCTPGVQTDTNSKILNLQFSGAYTNVYSLIMV